MLFGLKTEKSKKQFLLGVIKLLGLKNRIIQSRFKFTGEKNEISLSGLPPLREKIIL
jgi:hypothetical protein